MTVFSHPEFDDHEQVVFFSDPESGLRAIIAVHDTTLGGAGGGCRMWDYADEGAALTDALRLSRAMSYKLAFIGAPYGGGKSVIIGDPERDKSEALLRAMGRAVESLGGAYTMAEDVGISVEDMEIVRQETGYVVGLADGSGDTSPPTAHGVHRGLLAVARHKFGRDGLDGLRIAVQGLGNVGYDLCRRLAAEGAILTVADVREERAARAVEEFGASAVSPDAILGVEADILAPCALGGVINDRTVKLIRAAAVAGAANNQLATPSHGDALHARGILYAPDYVINAGGAINASEEGPNYDREACDRRIDGIYDTLLEIFGRADAEGVPAHLVADRIAEERLGRR